MSYSAEISRSNPTCFIFVLDQSGSMTDLLGGGEVPLRKADFLADVANRTLHDLIIRCTKTEEIRNYYHVAVIGYGGAVVSAFTGPLAKRELVPIAEVADSPARIDTKSKKIPDGAGGLVEQQVKFPIWVDPQGNGGTPMCEALNQVKTMLTAWLAEHPFSFPPTVLHITDGESTDGDPTAIGQTITSLSSTDGNVLVYNCHISSQRAPKIEFPAVADTLPNDYARTLFKMSSILPEQFRKTASQIGVSVQEGSRGFVFNADATALVQFFDIGTRPSDLR
jgi:hypothetical protein